MSSAVLEHQASIGHRGSRPASRPGRALLLTPCPPVTPLLDCSSLRNLWEIPHLWASTRNVPVSLRQSLTWRSGRDKVLGLPLPDLWDSGERWSHPETLSPFWVSLQTGPLSGFLKDRLDVVTLPAAASSCEETLSLHLSIYLSITYPFTSSSIQSSFHRLTYLSIHLSFYRLSTYLPTYLPIHQSIHPSTYLPSHPSIYWSV